MKRTYLLLVITLLLLPTQVLAVETKEIFNIKQGKFNEITAIDGEEHISTSTIDGTKKELVLMAREEAEEVEDWNYSSTHECTEYECTYYYIKNNYVANFTTDTKTYVKKDISEVIKSLYGVEESKENQVEIISNFSFNDNFYLFGTISNIVTYEDEYETKSLDIFMIKTSDGINYTKVDLPDYNGNDSYKIYEYKETLVLGSEKYYYEDMDTYKYYTTTDSVNWTERELDINKLDLSDEYYDVNINYLGVCNEGAVFTVSSWIYETEFVTKDFINYTKVDTSDITAPNSIAVPFEEDWDYEYTSASGGELAVLTNDSQFTSNNQPYTLKYAYKYIVPIYSKTKGFDLYISDPYGNKYEHIYGNPDENDGVYWFYTWEYSKINPINIFITKEDNVNLIIFKNYTDKNYEEYTLENIQTSSIQNIELLDGKLYILYAAKYLLILDEENMIFKKMELPYSTIDFEYRKSTEEFIFYGDEKIYSMTPDEATKQETENIKPGDVNGNNETDLGDILITLKLFFKSINNPSDAMRISGDMNHDNVINLTDVLLLLKAFFKA